MNMKPSAMRALLLLLTPTLAGAAPGTQDAGATFLVPRPELLATVKTIGVLAVRVDYSVPNAEPLAVDLERQIVARLEGSGFTVVPPSAEAELGGRAATKLGGLFDPMTGLPIRERMDAFQEFMTHEYRAQHPVDATLRAMIQVRRATFSSGSADWDGVRERVTTEHGLTAVLQGVMSGGMSVPADVPALSLSISVVDAHGTALYRAHGGLLVLAYPTLDGTIAYYNLASIDAQLASSLNARAMSVALDPLASGTPSPSRVSFISATHRGPRQYRRAGPEGSGHEPSAHCSGIRGVLGSGTGAGRSGQWGATASFSLPNCARPGSRSRGTRNTRKCGPPKLPPQAA